MACEHNEFGYCITKASSTWPQCSQHKVPLSVIYDLNGVAIRYECPICNGRKGNTAR